jgi:CheY-like chemotaxis protein
MHDVNNALNPIMAAAYLLRHHAESPSAVRDYADRIRQAAETAAATASRVGRFIRQEPLHSGGDVSIDLSELGNEVLELTEPIRLRRSSQTAAIRTVRNMPQPVSSRGLPGEIREALLCLVQNAVDAMPTGGTLTMGTWVDGADACIAVQDDGIGMSDAVRDRAFEPFFSTKGAGGTGLGLAEVYGIARRHRGNVSIESVEGEGTTVTLRLPTAPIVPEVEVHSARRLSEPDVRFDVLVVEDHEDGRDFLRRLLESNGHAVHAVGSCAEAREALAIPRVPHYDLLLTDVGLPDGSGWDLVLYARAQVPNIRIGVITGWEPMVSADDAVSVEFVLRKPLRAAELLAHISGAIRTAPSE